MKTDLGKQFLRIVDECFPRGHALRAIFNRNTLKLSYSCMPSVKSVIDAHNKRLLQPTEVDAPSRKLCNCRKKDQCPLNNQCLEKSVIYQAIVTSVEGTESYVGLTDTEFKTRYGNHKQSFKKAAYRNQTELSKYVWQLKDKQIEYNISWKILAKSRAYSSSTKRCKLCTLEKYFIICCPQLATLNKRSELASSCRHNNKFLLKSM